MKNVQIPDDFIGRRKEIDDFTCWFADPHAPWLLYIYDKLEEREKKGGVGKTQLLKKFATLASQQQTNVVIARVDFFNIEERNGVVVAELIVRALQEAFPGWSPRAFSTLLEAHHTAIRANHIYEAESSHEQLAFALIADLEDLQDQLKQTNMYLLVFFDTFETIEKNPVVAVLRSSQTFPDTYRFSQMRVIMAGRNALDWDHPNWQGRKQEVSCLALSPFDQEEMIQYLVQKINDEETVAALGKSSKTADALYERTEGRPILIGLVADVVNNFVTTIDELAAISKDNFEAYLISQINNLTINWTILLMAHAYHRFNLPLLKAIISTASLVDDMQEVYPQKWVEELSSLSFVRRGSTHNVFVLHDEMRRLIIKHYWNVQDLDQRNRFAISRGAISYYEQAIAQEQNESALQAYSVEMLYHRLYLDIHDGLQYFERHFNKAISLWLTAFARSLLQEAQIFTGAMSISQLYHLMLAEAKLLRKEENPEAALSLYHHLEMHAEPNWLLAQQADLLFEKGSCYLQMSSFADAIRSFLECQEREAARGNDDRLAEILYLLGYCCRRQGQLQKADDYYQKSIAIHKMLDQQRSYANVLNSIANLYRLQGKMEEALRLCKVALHIRKDLFLSGKTSEVSVGLSLSTRGVIYLNTDDLSRAEADFREAQEIFTRTRYKKGTAAIYNRLGQIEIARGNLLQAMNLFEKGYYAAIGIDKETQINSLNKQGWVFILQSELERSLQVQQKKLEMAISPFENAIELARKTYDYYQEAESLIDLADAYERLGQHEASQFALKEALFIAKKYSYNLLLGIVEEFQGDNYYRAKNYRRAFRHFAEFCHYMALYNPVRYNKALRKLFDTLISVPKHEIFTITDILIDYWRKQGLAQDFPELIRVAEEAHQVLL